MNMHITFAHNLLNFFRQLTVMARVSQMVTHEQAFSFHLVILTYTIYNA